VKDIQQNLVCFNTFGADESWTLATYEKFDGYKAWRRILAGERSRKKSSRDEGIRPAGTRWRRLPDRSQVEFHAAQPAGTKVSSCAIPMRASRAPATIARSCATTRML
jgi:hypothetical protein